MSLHQAFNTYSKLPEKNTSQNKKNSAKGHLKEDKSWRETSGTTRKPVLFYLQKPGINVMQTDIL